MSPVCAFRALETISIVQEEPRRRIYTDVSPSHLSLLRPSINIFTTPPARSSHPTVLIDAGVKPRRVAARSTALGLGYFHNRQGGAVTRTRPEKSNLLPERFYIPGYIEDLS